MNNFLLYLYQAFRDLLWIPVLSALFLFDLTKKNPKSVDRADPEIPVLLIHGYCHNSSGWYYYLKKFKEAGRKKVFTVNLGDTFGTIEKQAETLAVMVKHIAEVTGRDEIILVGHSRGGLVATYYATCLAKPNTVLKIITIASPMNGAKLAGIGFHQTSKEMQVGSPLTGLLQQKMREDRRIDFLHIGGLHDFFVVPATSALVYGLPNHRNMQLEMSHLTFLFSPEMFGIVLKEVSKR